ncbi:MAG: isochorismatase family cysteine hydrolase [Spirochaetia bacterium]|jgi:ureidoacrylate peracid hydrolase
MNKKLRVAARYFRWFPADRPLGRKEETLVLDATESAFVLVDVYLPETDEKNQVLSSAEYTLKHSIAVDHIAPALEAARKASLPVVYVTNSAPQICLEKSEFAMQLARSQGFAIEEDFSEQNVDPREYRQGPGRWLCFTPSLQPRPGDIYIRKHVYSGFYSTRLEAALRHLNVRNLIFAGFRIDCCLGSTMLDALYRNFRVLLLRDCTLACELPEELEGRQFTERMLIWFETMIGMSIDSRDFIEACARL